MTPSSRSLSVEDVLNLLSTGDIEVLGLLPYSSNYVFVARVGPDPEGTLAIYKPTRGERPLWDFQAGTLAAREVATFLAAEAAGWHFVPPTVLRDDAPLGPGSLQLFIDHDPERHYFTLVEERRPEFEGFAAFDIVVNNADRKAGHILEDRSGRLWGVDHGLTFNAEPKLRTVIWEFAGHPVGEDVAEKVENLRRALLEEGALSGGLEDLLTREEVSAARRRAERLLEVGRYPEPTSRHHLPWPLV